MATAPAYCREYPLEALEARDARPFCTRCDEHVETYDWDGNALCYGCDADLSGTAYAVRAVRS